MIGLYAGNAHLFPIPSMFLTGAAAASGIAWVNSLGILAGGVNPPILGGSRTAPAVIRVVSISWRCSASLERSSPLSACGRRPQSWRLAWFRRRSDTSLEPSC